MSVVASGLTITNGLINPSIVDDGLVLYYDVNNPRCYQSGSSVVQDLSSANLDGGLVNNPQFNEDPFYFTGFTSNQYVGVTNTGWASQIPTGNSERTIVSAFRTPNAFTANYYHILHYGDPSVDEAYGFAVWTNTGNGNIAPGGYDAVLGNHTWNGTFYAQFGLTTETDYIGIIRYRDTDSPRSSMYINRQFQTVGYGQGKSSDYSINTGTSTAPRMGNRISTPSEPLGSQGRIYSILFYDRFLSDDEVEQVYDAVSDSHNIG
jgi:hypothetical protein